MPLLEQFYIGPPYLFLPQDLDVRNTAVITKSEDVVTLTGVIVTAGLVPLDDVIFSGARLDPEYVGAGGTFEGVTLEGEWPVGMIVSGAEITIGSLNNGFSVFAEACRFDAFWLADPAPEALPPPVPGTAAASPGPFGVRRLSRG